MAEASRLRVPERHIQPLRALVELSDEAFERLLETFKEEPPALDGDELTERVASAVPELGDEAVSVVEALLVIDLLRVSRHETPDELAETFRQAAGLPGTDEERRLLSQRVGQAVSIPPLLLTAKAVDLLVSNERNYSSGRIVTELRPVFGQDATQPPSAGVVVHRLELTYYGPDGRSSTFHVALDDDDVADLQDAVVRAQAKAKAMDKFASGAGLRITRPRRKHESERS